MNMLNELAMYVLAALVLALGGVSLFVQKVYKVDKETGEEVEIELPWFGKLKTNYPALAFAFIGAAMAIFTFNRTYEVTDQWVISGSFKAADSPAIDWSKGVLTLYPKQFNPDIQPDGSFHIELPLPRTRKFEDVIGQISYFNWSRNAYADIMVVEEYQKFKKSDSSTFLKTAQGTTRRYGPVEVRVAPKPAR
jgi:hypothetical protein